jgi:hypothetical protein
MNYTTQINGEEKNRLLNEGKAVNENGLIIYRHMTVRGKPALKIWTIKSSKPISNYYFDSLEQMEKHIQEKKDNLKSHLDMVAKWKEDRKQRGQDLHTGDIVYHSWGYDQTNIDFYQIVRETKSTVILRPIASHKTRDCGFMSEMVVAVKNHFTGSDEIKHRQSCYSKWAGRELNATHYA